MSAWNPEEIEIANDFDNTHDDFEYECYSLSKHIQKKNAETQTWLDENPECMAGMFIEDLSHWHDYQVFTPEDFDKYLLKSNIWDAFKDLHGVRPRHMDLDNMTLEQLQAELDDLSKQFEEEN